MTTAITGKRQVPESPPARPTAKQARFEPTLATVAELVEERKIDPTKLQELLDFSYSLVAATKKTMSSNTICSLCGKGENGSMESRRKCKCRIFTVCQDCEHDNELEGGGIIECKGCENLLCSAKDGKCERRKCEVCEDEVCKDCLTESECKCYKLCEVCADNFDCVDCING